VYGFNDVRRGEIETAELLVPKPSAFEVEMATEKLKRHKNPVNDQISEEIIKAGSRRVRTEICNHCTETGSILLKSVFIK